MPDIDLTPMNEAAARALFAEQYAANWVNAQDDLTAGQKAHLMVDVRENARKAWDANLVPADAVLRYRELALAATLVTWKDVARQAWDAAIKEAGDCGWVPAPGARTVGNPYEEDA